MGRSSAEKSDSNSKVVWWTRCTLWTGEEPSLHPRTPGSLRFSPLCSPDRTSVLHGPPAVPLEVFQDRGDRGASVSLPLLLKKSGPPCLRLPRLAKHHGTVQEVEPFKNTTLNFLHVLGGGQLVQGIAQVLPETGSLVPTQEGKAADR